MLIHLWLMLLIPSIVYAGDKGKGSKPKAKAAAKPGGKAAAVAAKKEAAAAAAPAAAPIKIKRVKQQTFTAASKGSSTKKRRIRLSRINGSRKSTTPTTPRTRRTTRAKFVTQSWNDEIYGKLEQGTLLIHNQNPGSIVVRELTHFIEKDNHTIYEEKHIDIVLDHNTVPKELQFHCHESEETKDRWSLTYTYFRKNYTIGTDVYFNLKKGAAQRPLCIAIDNRNKKNVQIRQPSTNNVVTAALKEV